MTLQIVFVAAGLALLLAGGDLLVRGASALAETLGVPPHIIGLTVIAFGTSTPELFINLLAAFKGTPELSFGNIIGSNIANIGLILGLSALIRPLDIQGVIITREIPMLLLASLATIILALDAPLRGIAGFFDKVDGLMLLLLFCVFLYYTVGDVHRFRNSDPLVQQSRELTGMNSTSGIPVNIALFLAGLSLLIIGGKLTVEAATNIAQMFGVPKVVIGLTIVAVGTSLPELVTSAVATWKGQTEIAVGNVIGSNIFNLLFVLGLSSCFSSIPIPTGGLIDLGMMLLFTVVLMPLAITDSRRLVRWEGALFMVFYVAYIGMRII